MVFVLGCVLNHFKTHSFTNDTQWHTYINIILRLYINSVSCIYVRCRVFVRTQGDGGEANIVSWVRASLPKTIHRSNCSDGINDFARIVFRQYRLLWWQQSQTIDFRNSSYKRIPLPEEKFFYDRYFEFKTLHDSLKIFMIIAGDKK